MSRARFWLLGLAVWLPGICSAAEDVAVTHAEPLLGYRVNARGLDTKPQGGEPAELRFNAFGRDFVLLLEQNARLAPMQASLAIPSGTTAYRGTLAGRPGSWVRLVLGPGGPAGIIFDGETMYGVEHAGDTAVADHGGVSIFRLADVYVAPGAVACGATEAMSGAQAFAAMVEELSPTPAAAASATLSLDLGAVADFEFQSAFGADAEAALLTRFNNVDGIFSEQLGVQISVARADIFDTSNDPFTATDASSLLAELAGYRGHAQAQLGLGLTHLFTGRDLDGRTAGIAYLGTVCAGRAFNGNSYGVGLSEGRRGATFDSLVAAHEIGHNFGSPHDAEAGSPCESTAGTFLMAPTVNGSDQFSPCSIEQMQPEIIGASCLTPIGAPDLAVAATSGARTVSASAELAYTFTVTNLGAEDATGVSFRATTSAGLELLAASAGAQACSIDTGATCSLGTLTAGTARQITLSLRANEVGTFAIEGASSADSDANANNDSASGTVTATAAVDLVLTGAAPSLSLDDQGTVTATLENAADFPATGVRLTATLTSGLRADRATLAGAACGVTGQSVTCPLQDLAAHESITLDLRVTATEAGAQQVSLSATANETETAPSDNELALASTVNTATAPETSDGGGGAFSWLALLGLLGAVRCSRQKRAVA
jgi:uncharacterized repeat protein (TIGR01451 family)